jgi:hypothetical protein
MLGGVCPRCGSAAVHRRHQGLRFVDRGGDQGGPWVFTGGAQQVGPVLVLGRGTSPDGWAYVCTSCGHWEHYISDRELLDTVAREWEAVSRAATGEGEQGDRPDDGSGRTEP